MAHGQLFSNNALALLDVSIGPTDLVIQVQPGLGDLFPAPGAGEWFLVTLEDVTSPLTREIVRISGRTGDVLSVSSRGHEGTVASAWAAGDTLVDHRITAGTLADFTHGPSTSETRLYDVGFMLSNTISTTILTFNEAYVPNSTSIWVGGLRQKRGVDYLETAPQQVTLQFVVSPADVTGGQNIVVDFTPT